MGGLSVILKESLPILKKLYEVEKPLHVATTVAIKHYIERFKKSPEWEKKVTFYSLNDNWEKTGTFAMVNTHYNNIFINTIEPWPHASLRRTLELINYDKPMVFICFRDIFRSVVFDVIRVQNLEITFDNGTKTIYQERDSMHAKLKVPDGYYLDSLNQNSVEKINSMWMHRFSSSYHLLSNCIAHNPSTGMFHKETGDLAAWCMTREIGAVGSLQIDNKYFGKGLGEIVFATQIAKMRQELGYEITGHVAHYNNFSLSYTSKMGFQWIDNYSWIGVRPKAPPKSVPLWGI